AKSRKVATIEARLAAIGWAHRLKNLSFDPRHPAIRDVMAGIRRRHGTPQQQKAAILSNDLRRMVDAVGSGPHGQRDRAILLLGFCGAFRRSELVALDVADLSFSADGLIVTVRRSKIDQDGTGEVIDIPRREGAMCPVAALEKWLAAGSITRGPVFPSSRSREGRLIGRTVADIVKQAAKACG